MSDLHLEINYRIDELKRTNVKFRSDPSILLLTGDICPFRFYEPSANDAHARSVKKSLIWTNENVFNLYDKVLYIPGNHEYYGSVFTSEVVEQNDNLQRLLKNPKIEIVNNKHFMFGDVVIVCATLWTDYFGNNDLSKYACERGMNDYRWIAKDYVKSRRISPDDFLAEHYKSLAYIKGVVEQYKDKKIVVATHMAPTFKSLSREHSGNNLDGAYATNLSEFILDNPNIKYWIHGHCHNNIEYDVGTCKVVSNGVGYIGHEKTFNTFDVNKYITV